MRKKLQHPPMPNLDNPHAILGVIYMTSPHNVGRVLNTVNSFLKMQQDDVVYRYFVEIVAHHCCIDLFKFLSHLLKAVTKENRELVEKVINEPVIIDIIKRFHPGNEYDQHTIFFVIERTKKIMSKENVLKILRETESRPVFVAFGHHPAISKDIKLQKKWIDFVAYTPKYVARYLPWYITDEALEEVADSFIYEAIQFIKVFLDESYYVRYRRALFTIPTMQKIISTYANNNNPLDGKYLLEQFKSFIKYNRIRTIKPL